ncbi:MAG: 3-phosphoserine/phosphohydroxythreonine transaminase [Ruoffia tabacinasalis]|uniref:3-phosphoserine/phosphohydroxythreonine transaminase n=1 Tax=Ruoffia sp. FAM 20857 TaxID=3259515 RepID=UPI000ED23AA5|nr:3-phosphoserine/phosphohydroxythreonine aminotransferase [Aerococcaceae bacterium]
MNRIYNFSAGPSTLPVSVLEDVSKNLTNYHGQGLSVMEMSHRSPSYMEIHANAKQSLRNLMNIPDTYEILFLQGGASTQFSSVPLNLLNKSGKADYILTGSFSKKAYKEALRYGDIQIAASTEEDDFTYIPNNDAINVRPDADYVHLCLNNTIYGTRFKPEELPQFDGIPLVADMSSNILSEEYDVSKFGLIYAGAQKNMGPAGLTVVIVRKDLVGKAQDITPTMLDYATQIDKDSMYNTPPTFAIYVAGQVFAWLEEQGGVKAIEAINKEKTAKLYDYIDQSDFYQGTARKENRSIMNVTFRTDSEDLDKAFAKEAQEKGLHNLKGHRSVGGMRASIYNAMPMEGIDALINFMKVFENDNKRGTK